MHFTILVKPFSINFSMSFNCLKSISVIQSLHVNLYNVFSDSFSLILMNYCHLGLYTPNIYKSIGIQQTTKTKISRPCIDN